MLLGEGEDTSALEKFSAPSPKTAPTAPPEPAQTAQTGLEAQAQTAPARGNGRIFASPLARRMAQQAGLDLAAITGSGPQGRVVKADIEAALSAERGAPAPAPPAAQPPPALLVAPTAPPPLSKERAPALAGNPPYTERPLTAMRRVIARRLTESNKMVPAFLSDRRLRDRRASEIPRRAQREIRRLPDLR